MFIKIASLIYTLFQYVFPITGLKPTHTGLLRDISGIKQYEVSIPVPTSNFDTNYPFALVFNNPQITQKRQEQHVGHPCPHHPASKAIRMWPNMFYLYPHLSPLSVLL